MDGYGSTSNKLARIIVLRAVKNLIKPTSNPRSGLRSERFDIYIAYFRKRAPTGTGKREKLEPGVWHANRGANSTSKIPEFSFFHVGHVAEMSGALDSN